MAAEWIRFWITAVFLAAGVITVICSVVGVFRFKNALERMHSAAICDSLGILLIVSGLCVASGIDSDTVKLLLVVVFLWCSSPISAHIVSNIWFLTDVKAREIPLIQADKTDGD